MSLLPVSFMKMETVKVIKPFPYGKKMYKPGPPVEVEEGHAFILEKAGLIVREVKPVVKRPLPIETREMEPEEETEPAKKKKRRTYRRMDLRAED